MAERQAYADAKKSKKKPKDYVPPKRLFEIRREQEKKIEDDIAKGLPAKRIKYAPTTRHRDVMDAKTMKIVRENMEKEAEGYMVMFPAQMLHQVFPFYENDGERISISGNVDIRAVA